MIKELYFEICKDFAFTYFSCASKFFRLKLLDQLDLGFVRTYLALDQFRNHVVRSEGQNMVIFKLYALVCIVDTFYLIA